MTWILALSSVGLVLWGVGVWSMCRAREEPWVTVGDGTVHESHLVLPPHDAAWHDAHYIQQSITVLRYRDRLLIGMRSRGETWMWVVEPSLLPCLWIAMWPAMLDAGLSLTHQDGRAVLKAVERYMAAEQSVAEQLESI